MEHKFWRERWKEGRIGFHQDVVHPTLLKWKDSLFKQSGASVLVPLAGKSHDVNWFAEEGHQVTAIELSSIAARQFHEEHGRTPQRTIIGPYEVLNSERCQFLVGDVFEAAQTGKGAFDIIWDRAALVALDPPRRERYAPLMLSLLKPGGFILLNTFRYPRGIKEGPPHSIEEHEVFSLYGDNTRIELLESEDRIEEETRWKEMGFSFWITSTWKITKG